MNILGISAFYHDSAAALLIKGEICSAAQEERFTRHKHDASFPENSIAFCLEKSGLSLEDIDYISFYDKPFLKFERLIETYVAFAPRGFRSFRKAIPVWVKEKLFQKTLLKQPLKRSRGEGKWQSRLLFAEHTKVTPRVPSMPLPSPMLWC